MCLGFCWQFQFPICYTDTNHDNVSRDYLQELFGNFPSNTAGMDEVQDDQSLGEYQIYDQYNDDSYSEDEDY